MAELGGLGRLRARKKALRASWHRKNLCMPI